MIKASTKRKITKHITEIFASGRSPATNSSDLTAQIVEIIEADAEPVTGYEPKAVEAICNSLIDVILDRRKAIDFQGHSVPESIILRLQKAMSDGKIHQVAQ